jgi:hypothetical protein
MGAVLVSHCPKEGFFFEKRSKKLSLNWAVLVSRRPAQTFLRRFF